MLLELPDALQGVEQHPGDQDQLEEEPHCLGLHWFKAAQTQQMLVQTLSNVCQKMYHDDVHWHLLSYEQGCTNKPPKVLTYPLALYFNRYIGYLVRLFLVIACQLGP